MKAEFWKNKNVLVTGHTGFKGSWLSMWLQLAGARVLGYSLPTPTHPSLFEDANVVQGMVSVEGDIRDLEHLQRFISECKPEIVIHMAAQSLVRYSYDHPVETYATNVMGTVNVLEAVRQSGSVRVVINVTSDKCYENRKLDRGYREDDSMGGFDPYSSSKGCAELVTAAYRNSFFSSDHRIALASVRAGNVIGGGDWALDRLIPDTVRAFMDNRRVAIRSPSAIRPWQYVLEPLEGYLTLAEMLWEKGPKFAEGWNFGPDENDAYTVSWVVERMIKLWGEGVGCDIDDSSQAHEAQYLRLDSAKARVELNWAPKLSLETALQWTIEWYKGYQNHADIRELSLNQITRYQQFGQA